VSANRPTPPPAAPGKAEIFAAIPGGSRRCRSQREWLRAALAEVEAQGWYANRQAHYAAVCRRLALSMDWRLRTSRPGHEQVAAAVGVSADTVARCVAWLQERGLLGLVSPGSTPELRPGVLYAGTGNLAAVYVLAVPKQRPKLPRPDAGQERFADLSGSRSDPDIAPRAREARPKPKTRTGRPPGGLTVLPRHGEHRADTRRHKRSEARAAASEAQKRSRELARLSPEHVRNLARAFILASWLPRDLVHALDFEPGGRQHGYTAAVRAPAGWVRARLALWLGPDGMPLPSPSQLVAEARHKVHAEQAAMREARRPPSGYAAGAALARKLLAAKLAEVRAGGEPAESVVPESVSPPGRGSAVVRPPWPRPAPQPGTGRPRRTPG
jgi:hypothetical protein